jgi:DNA invertase Pin-like site-specific DNA recombinase
MPRAVIYGRVSTVDRGQDPDLQLRQLREFATVRGFDLVGEYVDRASGCTTNGRPEFKRMMADAKKRRFDVLLVWRYDRFARSMQDLVNALSTFQELGVDFISYSEAADTTTAQGKLLFGIMASLAEFERSLIVERTKAGLAAARARGAKIGRPKIPAQLEAAIRHDFIAGKSLYSVCKSRRIGHATAQRIRGELREQGLLEARP